MFMCVCRYWLKVSVTFLVVLGIGWIGNVLFFDVNLLFIAYIMTIFIAGQGIIIFIVLVPLSKQVNDLCMYMNVEISHGLACYA